MAHEITKAGFQGAQGTAFRVSDAGVTLTLEVVADGRSADAYECFSLEFRGPRDQPLEQGTVELTNAQLGTFELFMTPVEEDDDGRLYQAVFNRARSAGSA